MTQQPKPVLKIAPKIKSKTQSTECDTEHEPIAGSKQNNKSKIIIKAKTKPVADLICMDTSTSSGEMLVDDSSSSTNSTSLSTNSTSLSTTSLNSSSIEEETYITPVYGVNMRVSFDNKYIYDMDGMLVGTVIDNKSIKWIDD
jgi:hypothetical protein